MPEEYYTDDSDYLYSDLYSFVLNSTLEQDAFLSEVDPKLEKLGMHVTFVENNGQETGHPCCRFGSRPRSTPPYSASCLCWRLRLVYLSICANGGASLPSFGR
jgi:hypothetical protein